MLKRDKTKPVYGLVCAGGGARGAYQVGVLKFIHQHYCHQGRSPFQIFTGSSCGSLNTSFYAANSYDAVNARLRLEELWMSFHVPSYHGHILKNAIVSLYKHWRKKKSGASSPWSLLDPRPMQDIVERGFSRKNLLKAFAEESTLGIAVAATELASGRTCWFQEGAAATSWNLFHSIGWIESIDVPHLSASCSVPVFLPPVQIGHRYYLDGSIGLIKPLSAALHMGATKVMSIATEKARGTELPNYQTGFRPRVGHVVRMLLNRLGQDSCADQAVELNMFNRFYEEMSRKGRKRGKGLPNMPLYHHEAIPGHYRPTEIMLFNPTKLIRDASGITDQKAEVMTQKRGTRFMFHQKFIRELIDLGYSDAEAKRTEFNQFFSE